MYVSYDFAYHVDPCFGSSEGGPYCELGPGRDLHTLSMDDFQVLYFMTSRSGRQQLGEQESSQYKTWFLGTFQT